MVGSLLGTMGLFLLFLGFVGSRVTGRLIGIFIDTRNKVSLSQFQIVLWTWILLSGYIVIVFARAFANEPEPLKVAWDERLWGLMGITIGSTIASGAVKNVKKGKDLPAPAAATFTAARPGIARQGILVVNAAPRDATLWDMFRGEEPANFDLIDIGKVQMFIFTLIAVLTYLVALFQLLGQKPAQIEAMPALDHGLVFILGISHAGYLGSKWTDKQPTSS